MRAIRILAVAVAMWSGAALADEFGPRSNMTSVGTQIDSTQDVGTRDTEISNDGALSPVSPRVPELDVPAEPSAPAPNEPTPDHPQARPKATRQHATLP